MSAQSRIHATYTSRSRTRTHTHTNPNIHKSKYIIRSACKHVFDGPFRTFQKAWIMAVLLRDPWNLTWMSWMPRASHICTCLAVVCSASGAGLLGSKTNAAHSHARAAVCTVLAPQVWGWVFIIRGMGTRTWGPKGKRGFSWGRRGGFFSTRRRVIFSRGG